MAFFVYGDRPGMIGKVGTMLGDAGHQHRLDAGRAARRPVARRSWRITVDAVLTPELLGEITAAAGMDDAWYVEL